MDYTTKSRIFAPMKKQTTIQYCLSLIFGVVAFIFWWTSHPELLSFHEQNQLFLFTSDYFLDRIRVAGGFADYLSEFLVQFYIYIGTGAAITAITLVLMQQLTFKTFKAQLRTWNWAPFCLSFFPAVLMWIYMMDQNTLLSYPLSILLTLGAYLLLSRWGWVFQLAASLPLYWLVGPVFVIQVALSIIDRWRKKTWKRAIIDSSALAIVAVSWVYACRTLWIAQYPWDTVLSGINYHRLTIMSLQSPLTQYLITGTIVIAAMLLVIGQKTFKQTQHSDVYTSVIISLLYVVAALYPAIDENPHDKNTHAILEQAYLVRKGDWNGVIRQAEKYKEENLDALYTPLSGNAVNLALAMTGQLATRMFEFPQTGIRSLLMPNVRDNVSDVITMEAFYQLGFINEAMRYAFDSQESIPNCRKSGRFIQRMAECNILNSRFDVASKYIDILKQSFFYRKWAIQAEAFFYDEEKINQYSEWALKRQYRLENDFLYYYPEMPKMLGNLVLQNRENRMAYDYFMASLLLTGDAQSFVANLPQQPKANQDPFPKGYRNYVEYMRSQSSSNVDATTGASPQ